MGSRYSDKAYEEIVYKHPDWEKTATDYEAGFAANLANDPVVKTAAHDVLTKLSKMLNSYYDVQKFKEKHPDEAKRGDFTALYSFAQGNLGGEGVQAGDILEEALLAQRESRDGAGQIGNKVLELSADDQADREKVNAAHQENQAMLDEVINGEGNFREQMTLLYNGFFQNGGQNKKEIANSRSFKNMMTNITREDALMMNYAGALAGDQEAMQLAPDFAMIEGQHAYRHGGDIMDTVGVAYGAAKAHEKKKGRGNAFSRFFAGIRRIFKSTRSGRKFVDQEGFGEAYYDQLGLPLSERERQYGTRGGAEALNWVEGGRRYKMPEPVTAKGMLQVAGASGTALRMLAAYRMMGADKKDLLYFRLALIGWMCSSRDHSLYEILKGSHNAGVKGYEDLSDAVSMYTSVDPLSPSEIRENYAPNKEYPHETIYKKIVQEVGDARRESVYESDKREAAKDPNFDYMAEVTDLRKQLWQVGAWRDAFLDVKDERSRIRRERTLLQAELKKKEEALGEAAEGNSEIEALKKAIAQKDAQDDELTAYIDAEDARIESIWKPLRERESALRKKGYNPVINLATYNLYSATVTDTSSWENSLKTDNVNAQDIALNIYTTSAFKVMNNSQKYGARIGNYIMYNYTNPNGKAFKGSKSWELENEALMEKVLVALRLSNRIAQDALTERQAAQDEERAMQEAELAGMGVEENRNAGETAAGSQTGGRQELVTMRGGKTPAALFGSVGSTFETRNLTSTSKSLFTADRFYYESTPWVDEQPYPNETYDKRAIMEFHLKNLNGVDISEISQFKSEQEVLVAANVVFKIVEPLTEMVYYGDALHPLSEYTEDEIQSIRNRENTTYKMRKRVVLEAVENKSSKFKEGKYKKQRISRTDRKKELQERARIYENMKARRRAAGQ